MQGSSGGRGGWLHFVWFRNRHGVRPLGVIARHDVVLCGVFLESLREFQQLLSRFVSFAASGCKELLEFESSGFLDFVLRLCFGPRSFQLQGFAEYEMFQLFDALFIVLPPKNEGDVPVARHAGSHDAAYNHRRMQGTFL